MKPGDPYETKDLDALRSFQRGRLRAVPQWVLDDIRVPPAPALETEDDRALIEVALRKRAAEELERIKAVLDRNEVAEEALAILRFLQSAGTDRQQRGVLSGDLEKLATTYEENHTYDALDGDTARSVQRTVLLLAWADDLAGDDYRDSRVQRLAATT